MSSQKIQSHIGTRHLQHTIQYASPNIISQHPGSNERTCHKSGIQASQNFSRCMAAPEPEPPSAVAVAVPSPAAATEPLRLPPAETRHQPYPKNGIWEIQEENHGNKPRRSMSILICNMIFFAFNSGNMGMYSEHHTSQSRCFYSHLTSPIRLDSYIPPKFPSHHRTSGTYSL